MIDLHHLSLMSSLMFRRHNDPNNTIGKKDSQLRQTWHRTNIANICSHCYTIIVMFGLSILSNARCHDAIRDTVEARLRTHDRQETGIRIFSNYFIHAD